MRIDFRKTQHILFFAVILPLLSYGVGWIFNYTTAITFGELPFWVETISPLYAYILLYTFFDKKIWHWKFFKIFKIVDFPDLRGRWSGEQRSTYEKDGKKVKNAVVLEIRQSFSNISIKSFYDRSTSQSLIANFYNINEEIYLFFTYTNDPNSLKEGTMQIHKGNCQLILAGEDQLLIGTYFNSNGNSGEIELRYKQKKLLGYLNTMTEKNS